jgi:adenylate cyclase
MGNTSRRGKVFREENRARATVPIPRDANQPSIAVLPLENLSADPEQEYFSDGMTDSLITSLAGIHGLRASRTLYVIPNRNMSFR